VIGVAFVDVFRDRFDFQSRVQFQQTPPRGFDAGLAQAGVGHEQLAIEVAGAHVAGMSEHEASDAGRRQLVGDQAPQATDSRN